MSLIICVLAVFVSGCKNADTKIDNLPFKFEVLDQEPTRPNNILPRVVELEIGGPGKVLSVSNAKEAGLGETNYVVLTDLAGQSPVFQNNFLGRISTTCMDVDDDGVKEILISEQIDNQVFLHILSSRGDSLRSFLMPFQPPETKIEWVCSARPVGMMDTNEDNRSDLILVVQSTYAYQPRGILSMDINTGEIIWYYATGPTIDNVSFCDLDYDGNDEILISSYAADNGGGLSVNGTDDSHSYLTMLNHRGEACVNKLMGQEHTAVLPLANDMDQDGHPEILVIKGVRSLGSPEKNMIGFWNFQEGRMFKERQFETQIGDAVLFFDSNDDGIDEFLTVWANGSVRIFNFQNEIINTFEIGETLSDQMMLFDLDSNGSDEIILSSSTSVYVLSKELSLLASFPAISSTVHPLRKQDGADPGLMVFGRDNWYRLEMTRNYAAFRIPTTALIGFLIGCLSALVGVYVAGRLKQNTLGNVASAIVSTLGQGKIIISANGIVKSIDYTARNILRGFDLGQGGISYLTAFQTEPLEEIRNLVLRSLREESEAQERKITLDSESGKIDICVAPRRLYDKRNRFIGLAVIIEDISEKERSRKIMSWTNVAQKLAHEIKNPLSSVMLATQRIQMELSSDHDEKLSKIHNYTENILNETRRLREFSDRLMKITQIEGVKLEPQDINLIIRDCVSRIQHGLSDQILIELELADDLPLTDLDKNQVLAALESILTNSIEASNGRGHITISSQVIEINALQSKSNGSYIGIEIADSGCGIPMADQEEIFDPFFSRKKDGTGLGLTIAKKVVEDHNGEIEVKSNTDSGTIISLRLPVNQEER